MSDSLQSSADSVLSYVNRIGMFFMNRLVNFLVIFCLFYPTKPLVIVTKVYNGGLGLYNQSFKDIVALIYTHKACKGAWTF